MLKQEFRRFVDRCIWSWQGWRDSWREEKSVRQWALANLISAALTFVISMTAAERALIIGFGILVLVAELLNTAIEAVVDDISPKKRSHAKRAKDSASAAVALLAIATGLIWLLVIIG
ncbi:MAG: diacylglycerol kinase [Halocynthiibacter sp.]